jgi:hypothetical protein
MSCSGDCNQGRTCDCCEEVQISPPDAWEQISYWFVFFATCAFASLTIGLVMGFVYFNFYR